MLLNSSPTIMSVDVSQAEPYFLYEKGWMSNGEGVVGMLYHMDVVLVTGLDGKRNELLSLKFCLRYLGGSGPLSGTDECWSLSFFSKSPGMTYWLT